MPSSLISICSGSIQSGQRNAGWIYREQVYKHMTRTKNAAVLEQLHQIRENPDGWYPVKGAYRRYPLSTYIKKKLRGKAVPYSRGRETPFSAGSR